MTYILPYAFYDSVSKNKLMYKISTAYDVTEKRRHFFRKYGSDVTLMTPSNSKPVFYKPLVNTNSHAKFGDPMTFGLKGRY